MSDAQEAAARAFYNAAGGSYEPLPAAAAPTAPVAQPAPVAPAPPASSSAEDVRVPAEAMYAPVLTRGLVQWDEAPAAPEQFELPAAPGVLDYSEEGRAAMARLRDGLAAAGAGVTVARELFGDAVRAQQDARWVVSRENAEQQLRQHFGARYEAQVEAARGLVQRAAARCPEIIPFLERTGLGNSPEFVRKLAAAAGKRARR